MVTIISDLFEKRHMYATKQDKKECYIYALKWIIQNNEQKT